MTEEKTEVELTPQREKILTQDQDLLRFDPTLMGPLGDSLFTAHLWWQRLRLKKKPKELKD